MIKNYKNTFFVILILTFCNLKVVILDDDADLWGGQHLPVLVMPQRCNEDVNDCPFGSQCRGGICFWSHCLADQQINNYRRTSPSTSTSTTTTTTTTTSTTTSTETTTTTTATTTTTTMTTTTTTTITTTSTTTVESSTTPRPICNKDWADIHNLLPYCYRKGYSVASKYEAITQCQTLDPFSSPFRFTEAELASVVLYMNNGDPIDTWTDAYLVKKDWYWGNGSMITLSNNLIEHGQDGNCLFLETMDVLFWGDKTDVIENPFGLDEAIGKLIPTPCTDVTKKIEVLCQTPKNTLSF